MTSDQVTRFKCVCFCRNLADILCEIGGTKKLDIVICLIRNILKGVSYQDYPDYVFHLANIIHGQ